MVFTPGDTEKLIKQTKKSGVSISETPVHTMNSRKKKKKFRLKIISS